MEKYNKILISFVQKELMLAKDLHVKCDSWNERSCPNLSPYQDYKTKLEEITGYLSLIIKKE